MKDFSIILETHNIGMSEFSSLENTLKSIMDMKGYSSHCKELILVIAHHFDKSFIPILIDKYPQIKFEYLENRYSYWHAKYMGFKASSQDLAVFLDMDMDYPNNTIYEILKGFDEFPDASVISLRSLPKTESPYQIAMAVGWMFHLQENPKPDEPITNFRMNIFAIKREALEDTIFKNNVPFFRGDSMLWKRHLADLGYKSYLKNNPIGIHETPRYFWDGFARILILGSDYVNRVQYKFNKENKLVYSKNVLKRIKGFISISLYYLFHSYRNYTVLFKKKDISLLQLLLSFPITFINLIITSFGAFLTIFSRNLVLNFVQKLEVD